MTLHIRHPSRLYQMLGRAWHELQTNSMVALLALQRATAVGPLGAGCALCNYKQKSGLCATTKSMEAINVFLRKHHQRWAQAEPFDRASVSHAAADRTESSMRYLPTALGPARLPIPTRSELLAPQRPVADVGTCAGPDRSQRGCAGCRPSRPTEERACGCSRRTALSRWRASLAPRIVNDVCE